MSTPDDFQPDVSPQNPFARKSVEIFGGRLGRHVGLGRHGWWTVARVLLVTAMVTMAVAVIQKEHCRTEGWSTPDQFFHACYSDLPLVFETSGLASGTVPYVESGPDGYLHQPVVTGISLWALGALTPDGENRAAWYFDVSTVFIALLFAGLVSLSVVAAGPYRRWDVALIAACPLVALTGLVSLDLLGVTLAMAALVAWGREKLIWAGVFLGLATMARTYPMVLILVLGVLAARAGSWRAWLTMTTVWAGSSLAITGPWLLMNAEGVLDTYQAWLRSGPGYGSLWFIPQALSSGQNNVLSGLTVTPEVATTLAAVGIGVAGLICAVLSLSTPRRPRVAQIAFVGLAIIVMTGKAWPVQAALWLLPFAVLAHPRWRDHFIWWAVEASYFMAVWLYLGGLSDTDRGLPAGWYTALVVIRLIGLGWLVWQVIHAMRWPDGAVEHYAETEDPLGGPLAHRDDRLTLQFK
ncbi:MAG: glycosyltransferase family 87 protein [Actinomycetota bacterium]